MLALFLLKLVGVLVLATLLAAGLAVAGMLDLGS
jgi:hypothetical protein